MRDIWIRDRVGNLRLDLGGCGLSTEVWTALYPILAWDPGRPLLARLWQQHWGADADAHLSAAEVETLAAELASLEGELSPGTPAAVRELLHGLAALCRKALRHGDGLEFVAD